MVTTTHFESWVILSKNALKALQCHCPLTLNSSTSHPREMLGFLKRFTRKRWIENPMTFPTGNINLSTLIMCLNILTWHFQGNVGICFIEKLDDSTLVREVHVKQKPGKSLAQNYDQKQGNIYVWLPPQFKRSCVQPLNSLTEGELLSPSIRQNIQVQCSWSPSEEWGFF